MNEEAKQKIVIPESGIVPGSRVDYALRYVKAGFKVFPLHHYENGRCSCGDDECRSKGKHPLVIPDSGMFGGVHSATDDRETLIRVFSANPKANIGIAIPDDMLAIDIDPRNGGDVTLDDLQSQYGRLPDTAMQLTGGGGFHYLYRKPSGNKVAGKLGKGIDIKASGGYIVGEPSNHESGNSYVWEASSDPLDGVRIVDAPAWVLNKVMASETATGSNTGLVYGVDEEVIKELQGALSYLNISRPDLTDDRDMWVRVGMACKSIGDRGYELWESWSIASSKFDAKDQWKKWQTFNPTAISYRTVFALAQAEGWKNPKAGTIQQVNQEATPQSGFRFDDVSELVGNIKPISWLVRDYVEAESLLLIYGQPGCGKSFGAVDIASCVATGEPFFGRDVKQGTVFYIAGEGHNGLARRFLAWQIERGVEVPKERLWKSYSAVQMLDPASVEAMADAIWSKTNNGSEPPALIVIDTLARNFGPGDENSTSDMTNFIAAVDKYLLKPFNCTVMIVHHSGHNMERARGSSALKAAVDAEFEFAKDEAGIVTISATKMKDAELPPDLVLKLKGVELPGVFDEDGIITTSAVLEACEGTDVTAEVGKTTQGEAIRATDVVKALAKGWLSKSALSEALGCSEASAFRASRKCVELGYLWAEGRRGGLTKEGESLIARTGAFLTTKCPGKNHRPWEQDFGDDDDDE